MSRFPARGRSSGLFLALLMACVVFPAAGGEVETGDERLRAGDYAGAVAAYNAHLASFPEDRDARYGLARALAYSGDHPGAEREYRTLLAADPGDVEGGLGLADVLAWQKKYAEAGRSLSDLAVKRPDDEEILLRQGKVALRGPPRREAPVRKSPFPFPRQCGGEPRDRGGGCSGHGQMAQGTRNGPFPAADQQRRPGDAGVGHPTSHVRPDGDAIGSLLGLGLALINAGKSVQMVLVDGVSASLRYLEGSELIIKEPQGEHDTFITVDCADFKRVGKFFEKFGQPDINIDHERPTKNSVN